MEHNNVQFDEQPCKIPVTLQSQLHGHRRQLRFRHSINSITRCRLYFLPAKTPEKRENFLMTYSLTISR